MQPTAAERPLFSVVVGVLNGGRSIEKVIDSFASQTFARKELLIKDGGSTDDTIAILERRSADIAYWTSSPDKGLYDAWNSVLPQCRGEYICFLGCDDVLADRMSLERLAASAMQEPPPDLICSVNSLVDDDGTFVRITGKPWSWRGMKRAQVIAHPGMMHRAELFQKFGAFDPSFRIGGDYEFLLRLGPQARAAFVDQVTVRVGGNGMSHVKWKKTVREIWRLQARNPEIGVVTATKNATGNVARILLRKLRGRR